MSSRTVFASLGLAAAVAAIGLLPRIVNADVTFEEVSSQKGGMSQPDMKFKYFISGDKFRAQKKMMVDANYMQSSMQESSRSGAAGLTMQRNMYKRQDEPVYPARVISLDEWSQYPANKKFFDILNGKGNALQDGKAKLMQGLGKFGPGKLLGGGAKTSEQEKKDAEDSIWGYYNHECALGIEDSLMKIATDKMLGGEGMEALFAKSLPFDIWLRIRIIREYIGRDHKYAMKEMEAQNAALKGETVSRPAKIKSLAGLLKISDTTSEDYKSLKLQYSKDPKIQAEYAGEREKQDNAKEAAKQVQTNTGALADEINNMQMSAQIVRLDQGKAYEIIPPDEKVKNPTPKDISYKEQLLDEVKKQIDKVSVSKADAAKKMNADPRYAQMQAAQAQNIKSELIGTEDVNGVSTEHWHVATGGKSEYDFWVAADLPGAQDILAFDKKCMEKIGGDRRALSNAVGGMPNTGDLMVGMMPMPQLDAEIAKITSKGLVVKRVVKTKQAAQSAQSRAALQMRMAQGMGPGGQQDPAAMAAAMRGAQEGRDMSGAQPGEPGSGMEDMATTYELKILATSPVNPKAFEIPEGAKKK